MTYYDVKRESSNSYGIYANSVLIANINNLSDADAIMINHAKDNKEKLCLQCWTTTCSRSPSYRYCSGGKNVINAHEPTIPN